MAGLDDMGKKMFVFFNLFENINFFNMLVFGLSVLHFQKIQDQHLIAKKCKIQREPNFGRPKLHMENFCKCFIYMAKVIAGKLLT